MCELALFASYGMMLYVCLLFSARCLDWQANHKSHQTLDEMTDILIYPLTYKYRHEFVLI